MKHLFVPYELALKLKEKGFDEPCITFYELTEEEPFEWCITTCSIDIDERWDGVKNLGTKNNDFIEKDISHLMITAPLYQQVIDWFREKHDLHIFLIGSSKRNHSEFCCEIVSVKKQNYLFTNKAHSSLPYYQAIEKAIEEALKLI